MFQMECPVRRAPRLTRAEVALAEAHQQQVNEELVARGDRQIALRLQHCQHARMDRGAGWPWRCRSAGCFFCRRTMMRRWWRGFQMWLSGPDISLAIIPARGDPFAATKSLRRSLRDLRDKAACRCNRWRSVALGGLVGEDCAVVLVQHDGINRAEVAARWQKRWPDALLIDPDTAEPSADMSVEHAATLARRRRGVETLRIVVPAQRASTCGEPDCAVPIVVV